MPEHIQLTAVTMPAFAAIVPDKLYREATISLGILYDGIPSGVICLYYLDYHYEITWFFVEETKRKKGLGSALLEGITKLVRDIEEVYPIECTFTSMDADILGIFQSYEHFYVRSIGKIYTISPKQRQESLIYNQILSMKEVKCDSFYNFETQKQESYFEKLRKKMPQLANYIKLEVESLEPALCLAYGQREIRAAFFAKRDENRIDFVTFLADDLVALSMLLIAGVKRIEKYYKDYQIRIVCFQDKTEWFVRKLFEINEMEFLLTAAWDLRLPGEYPAFSTVIDERLE